LGIDQEAAVLLKTNGDASVVGKGNAYLIEPAKTIARPEGGRALTTGPFLVQRIRHGSRFDLFHAEELGDYYQLAIREGTVQRMQSEGALY